VMGPCKKCGGTERNKWGQCLRCNRARAKERYATKNKAKAELRVQLRADRAEKGRDWPCIKCGSTERSERGDCLECARAQSKVGYQTHKARSAEYKQKWLKNHPDRAKEFDLRVRLKRYGLTVEQYREMFDSQKGLCCICEQMLDRIDIDHDHKTGQVRGLLCHACNIGLGAFQDDPQLLMRAMRYLKDAGAQKGRVPSTTTCSPPSRDG